MTNTPDSRVSNAAPSRGLTPPVARREDFVRELHGDRRLDGYAWMRRLDPEAMANLSAERSYYDVATRHLSSLVRTLIVEMSSRLPLTDSSISSKRVRFSYYTRTPSGSEYAQLCRAGDPGPNGADGDPAREQMLLDPAELAGDSDYVDVGLSEVSPDERLLAYAVDTTGDEVFTLRFRDLERGDDLEEVVPRAYYTGAWSADSTTFFYTVHDEMYRPYQVWRHRIGTGASADILVYTEADAAYEIEVRGSRSGDVIALVVGCRDTSEVWLLDAHAPESAPRLVEPRRKGLEYVCEHARTPAGDRLFIVTNDGAVDYRLMVAPLETPDRDHWAPVIDEHPNERLYEATAFAGHLVVTLRRDGVLMARSYALSTDGSLIQPGIDLAPSMVAGTLELADNFLFDAAEIHIVEQSYTAPRTWYSVDLATGVRRPLRREDVPGYDADVYVSERIFVPSDGVEIPVTLVRHRETPLDGTAPCLLYGYGAYEACFEPAFDATLASLLDRGVVWAHAHVRGGGERGQTWWLDGRLDTKQHSFSDHIAAANCLGDTLVDGKRIVTRGLSAGGLLQGAVFSQASQRWCGVIAEVPAVDIVTSMLDPSIPLTINEFDEWGDPWRDADYRWMRAYSPYDNIPPAGERPDLLVTGAVHDPRVMVWEPAKWVAELRYTDPDWSPRCLFRVELGEGAHVGPSGRYAHARYEAEISAWALERFGLTNPPSEGYSRRSEG